MTDAGILGKLDAANMHDSAGGSMAVSKGTNSGVKEFGRMMMKDHHQMRTEGMDVAKKASLTPENVTSDPDVMAMQSAADSLNSMAKGADWDKAYIEHAVMEHEKVLNYAQSAANSAQNADLKAMIQKGTPIIQKHLDKAKELQSKMGGASTGAMGADTTKKP